MSELLGLPSTQAGNSGIPRGDSAPHVACAASESRPRTAGTHLNVSLGARDGCAPKPQPESQAKSHLEPHLKPRSISRPRFEPGSGQRYLAGCHSGWVQRVGRSSCWRPVGETSLTNLYIQGYTLSHRAVPMSNVRRDERGAVLATAITEVAPEAGPGRSGATGGAPGWTGTASYADRAFRRSPVPSAFSAKDRPPHPGKTSAGSPDPAHR